MEGFGEGFGDPEPPKSHIFRVSSNFQNPKSNHEAIVSGHHFNRRLGFIFPTSQMGGANLSKALAPSSFTHTKVFLHELLSPEFLAVYGTASTLTAVSCNSPIDGGNTACILPSGELFLAVDKDTYQQLGLPARRSKFPIRGSRWLITLNLKSPKFVPGHQYYERVLWCLKSRVSPIEMLFVFSSDTGFDVSMEVGQHTQLKTSTSSEVYEATPCPLFGELGDVDDCYDWIGAVHTKLDSYFQAAQLSDFASNFHYTPDMIEGDFTATSLAGFFSSSGVLNRFNVVKEAVRSGTLDWAVVTVWGFEDSLFSWSKHEHYRQRTGENDYTFLLLPEGRYILFKCVGELDSAS